MSKTFKSAFEGTSFTLQVCKNLGAKNVSLWIVGGGYDTGSIAIADKDIPSLMLELGEAAGIVPKWNSWSEGGTPEHLAHILSHLQQYVDAQADIAAQAEETAKLEAEALELYNSYRKGFSQFELNSWIGNESKRELWLAVARKAREIGN